MVFRIIKKYTKILSKHQKIRILELGVIMIIGGFMEMLSVSLMLPFMEAVMTPEKIMGDQYIMIVCNIFGIQSSRIFLVLLAVVMACVYVFKNIFLLFQMHIQNCFVYNNLFMTQQRLLRSFLNRPYEYYLGAKSGEILRIIQVDTTETFNLLTALLSLVSELIVSTILIITIFVIAPGITLGMAFLLFVILLLIMKVLRPVLRRLGLQNQSAYTWMNQWLLQTIQGIKEIKILQKESYFEERFKENGNIYVKTNAKNTTLNNAPRFMIEATAMSSVFIMIAFMIYHGSELENIVPMLSSVAVAAIRLLPSVNRISISLGSMAFAEPKLDKTAENLNVMENYNRNSEGVKYANDVTEGIVFRKTIDMEQITYQYPSGDKNVLCNADLHITKGQSIGIIGKSGAGKTTVLDILLGLLKPQGGKVIVDDLDIENDMDGWLSQIGYIPQSVFLLDGTIRENVAFGVSRDDIDEEKVWEALNEAALKEFVSSLPDGIDTQTGERGVRLSGGQRQRIAIARALYNNPSILFFDEATSALDNETESAIMESIDHLHGVKTMVIIAHRLSTIDDCDHVYKVDDGKILRER